MSGHSVDSDIPKGDERNLSDGAEGVAYQDEGVGAWVWSKSGMVSGGANGSDLSERI